MGFVHRDIKAENFVLKGQDFRDGVKLLDFGMATALPLGPAHRFFGRKKAGTKGASYDSRGQSTVFSQQICYNRGNVWFEEET